jgi:hypothetical protein
LINILRKRAVDAGILLIVGIILAYAFLQWNSAGRFAVPCAFIILFGGFYFFKKEAIKQKPTPTPALAIVMSMGVFVSDFFNAISINADFMIHFVQLFVLCIFLLWLFFILSYTKTIFTGSFYLRHMSGTLNSFGMGTWIAGASVCSMGIIMYLPEWIGVAYFIVTINSLLWGILVVIFIRNLIKLIKDQHLLLNGIVLLSTVSTMSLAIDYSLVLDTWRFRSLFIILMSIGTFFYLAFIALIIRSLLREKWTLINDFRNTNCIFHGALSITGLAGIMTGVLSPFFAWGLWTLVILIFIVVEALEVARAKARLRNYGFSKALGTYHVSQWARNFTFSMLLAFTFKLPTSDLGEIGLVLLKGFSYILFIAVVFLLIYEGYLFMKDQTFLLEAKISQNNAKKDLTVS